MQATLRLLITAARVSVAVTRWLFVASRLTAKAAAMAAIVVEDVMTHVVSYHVERRAELAAAQTAQPGRADERQGDADPAEAAAPQRAEHRRPSAAAPSATA